MARIVEVDGTGARVMSQPEAENEILGRYSRVFGQDLATAAQTPQGQLAGIDAVAAVEVGEEVVRVANSMNVNTSIGVQLDAHGTLLEIVRRDATRSQVSATVTGVAAVVVPAGSMASTTAGAVFRTVDDTVLSPSGVVALFEGLTTGPVEAAVGDLTRIVTVVAGWETVVNAEAATLGRDRQSDAAYVATYPTRTARLSTGPMAALGAGLEEALASPFRLFENATAATAIVQEWSLPRSSILVIASAGSDTVVERTVESYRGQGVATVTAIRGGAHADAATLRAITAGTVTWAGVDYSPLDLSADTDGPAWASRLTALLPAGVTVRYLGGRFVAMFGWSPTTVPQFGAGTVEVALGLNPAAASGAPGPFVRPVTQNLVASVDVTRQPGFPADGVAQIRAAVLAVVDGYQIGEQVWANDLLSAAEGVGGTRVTATTVQFGGVDVSGVSAAADVRWGLPTTSLTVTPT